MHAAPGNRPPHHRRSFGRVPSCPEHWQNYLLCVLLHMVLPLFPIGMELWRTGTVTNASITLAASMYAIGIGLSSRSRLLFGLALVASLAFAFAYGAAVGNASMGTPNSSAGQANPLPLPYATAAAWCGIVAFFVAHALERLNRHVIDREPFLEFMKSGEP